MCIFKKNKFRTAKQVFESLNKSFKKKIKSVSLTRCYRYRSPIENEEFSILIFYKNKEGNETNKTIWGDTKDEVIEKTFIFLKKELN